MNSTLKPAPARTDLLNEIQEVSPLNEGDLDCLTEIRDVLKHYGMQDRFGVALLHKHFDMADGEVLLEQTEAQGRVLTIAPVPHETTGASVGTLWMLSDEDGRKLPKVLQGCYFDLSSGRLHNAQS